MPITDWSILRAYRPFLPIKWIALSSKANLNMSTEPIHKPAAYSSDTNDKWSSYWAGNRVAACMEAADGNYNEVIGQHWQRFFSQLPAGSRVLDLATGNGAVLHFAVNTAQAQDKHLDLYGVDLASIDPWSHLDRNGLSNLTLTFLPRVDIENLPFANDMFDAVVSQYGAEYANLEKMVAEAIRVLKPGGIINWVCHSDDSVVYANTVREIKDARYLLEEAAVTEHLQKLIGIQTNGDQFIPNSHQVTLQTPERQAMVKALQGCFIRLRESEVKSEILDVALQNLAYIYQHREAHTPTLVSEKVDEIRTELSFFIERLEALVSSAITDNRIQQIKTILDTKKAIGFHSQPITKPDGLMVGLHLSCQKAD